MFLPNVFEVFQCCLAYNNIHKQHKDTTSELLRNQALAAHFALASWFGFVAQGHDTSDLLNALAADSSRQMVELSFTGCRGFTDDSLQQLALAADSSRQMVELSFTGCRGFTDDSLQQLLRHLPRLWVLRFMSWCTLKVRSLQEMHPLEMPPLEELTLRFTGSRLANASGLVRMLDTEHGLARSLRSLQLWFSNLPSLVELGSWEPLAKLQLEELALQAWHWTELSLLFAMQAAAEIEHPITLAAILLSLYPVACLSLEESLGVSWAVTCTLLAVAVLCDSAGGSAYTGDGEWILFVQKFGWKWSPQKVLDALRCELICEDMLGVQQSFNGLKDRLTQQRRIVLADRSCAGHVCRDERPQVLPGGGGSGARIGAALTDAVLDLGYILTYLGMVSWFLVGPDLNSLRCLEELDLTRTKLQELHDNAFRGLEKLKLLAMSDNDLSHLSAPLLRQLPLLEQLLLGGKYDVDRDRDIVKGNRITELGAVFGHNAELQVIDLSRNGLRRIDPAAFTGLRKLRTLRLGANRLTIIPAAVQGLAQLWTLELGGNQISSIPADALQSLVQLQKLDLSSNKISSIPTDAFQSLVQLQHLYLSSNKISSIPTDAFQSLVQLQHLDLYNNEISRIPTDAFQSLVQLQHLDLGYNWMISSIPTDAFQSLVQLQHLDLSSNKISRIPTDAFRDLKQLQELDLRYNQISSITPDAFHGLVQLQKLDLYYNEISSIAPDAFRGLVQLQKLDLEENKISTIPKDAFQGLKQLQELDLRYNQISSITPDAFHGLVQLQKLDLRSNKISSIAPDAFRGLVQLQKLDLEDNKISAIPKDAFQGLARLKSLELQYNQISSIAPDAFRGLAQLETLKLPSNDISSISTDAFQGLVRLTSLELQYNQISSIAPDAFQGLVRLQKLDLSGNKIK
eukprot:s3126_g3.t1